VKILITTEQYYPIKSGVSSVVTAIAEELVRLKHEVYVATGDQKRSYAVHHDVNIIEFKIFGGFGNFYRGEKEKYRDFLKGFECDVMINECVQTWSTDLILNVLDEVNAKKKFLHSHGFSLLSYRTKNPLAYIKSKFYYATLYEYLKKYNYIFLLHDKTVETPYLQKHEIKQFSYLPNGVTKSFISKKNLLDNRKKYLLSISNYFPFKNQEFLLEAYYKSQAEYPLILIGNSVLKEYLQKLKLLKAKFDSQYGFRNVEFLYQISREETEKYLENATLFLHSSKLEVFPMVIVESMAKGVPFICTDVGNVSTLKGGCVIQAVDEMSATINDLLNHQDKYHKLVEDGTKSVSESLTWEKIVKNLEKYFFNKD